MIVSITDGDESRMIIADCDDAEVLFLEFVDDELERKKARWIDSRSAIFFRNQ